MTPLKAGRRLTTIGWEEIKLTLDESGGIAGLCGKHDINDESIRQTHELTQGWAAGVILMMEYKPSHHSDVPLDTKEDVTEVFDYFAELFQVSQISANHGGRETSGQRSART